jgi:large repetitive protein
MKRVVHIPFLFLFLFTSSFFYSQNLLNNGDFEIGGVGVGFNIDNSYTFLNAPTGNTAAGNYAFTTNPLPYNPSSFIATGDHTTGAGNMMIVDGSNNGGNPSFWKAGNNGGGICGLTVGATYRFSYWIRSIFNSSVVNPTRANINVVMNNANSINLVSGQSLAPLTTSGWQQVIYSFVPTNACVNIELRNLNTGFEGNDFAIDDLSVLPPVSPLRLTFSFNQPKCSLSNDGVIVAYGNGGVTPYQSYTLTGAATPPSNTTGIFSGLAPGTYNLRVLDANGNQVIINGITLVALPGIIANPNSTACSGVPTTLNASGSTSGYTWTASPPDVTLTTPNISNPIVSPTQTTTYTVTSTTTNSINLVTNGNFSAGNSGFDTDYTFFSPNNPTGIQRAYGVVTNPNTWLGGFAACTDNTTTTGQMMVVDGSTSNSGNDMVWGQTIIVNPNQNYTFSYWLQTLSPNNPAIIRTVINGVLLGTATASASVCGWTQYTYNWNSGLATTAFIQLFDSNTLPNGNDFSLDDIEFTTNSTCNATASTTITVTSGLTPTITCGIVTANSITFNWVPVSGANSYTRAYRINGGPLITVGTLTSLNHTTGSLNPGDQVEIFVTPVGTGCYAQGSQICVAAPPCVVPNVTVTQQPTCANPTGTIEFTSPVNTVLPIPNNLFISEVTDANVGALTYVEIFNGTGAVVNLANYKLKIFNNGSTTPNCDLILSGTLANNSVVVVAVGSTTNIGGVTPNLVFSACTGVNNNDNIRLATITDVEFDNWGPSDGSIFTPAGSPGFTYRRNVLAPHPTMIWNPADWTAIDPEDYTAVGGYNYIVNDYQYSVVSPNYVNTRVFNNLTPGTTYNVTIRDLVTGCVSTPIPLTINAIPITPPPTVSPVNYCLNAAATPLSAVAATGGTLNWYGTNQTGGTASSTAPTPLTNTLGPTPYYVSQTIGGCESVRVAIVVTISNQAPTAAPFLFCDATNSSANSVNFDFNNNVGQTSYSYSYSIDGGVPVTGIIPNNSPSNFSVPNVLPGQTVSFTLTWDGVCTPSQTATTRVPLFNQVAPICSGDTLLPLSTISQEGANILGTWSPALNNTATTVYTFTPNPAQCASRTTMTIVVNPGTIPTFTQVAPICSGQPLAALPTTSLNGITGTWSPALSNTLTTTYTFTPTTGQCASTTTMTIDVTPNTTPTFNSVAPICSGQVITALPTTSLNGIIGTWSPALNNTTTTTYTFTPTTGQCTTTAQLLIVVNLNVLPTFNAVTPICSGQTLATLPTTSLNGVTGSWSPPINNTATTTYNFTPDAGQCALTNNTVIFVNQNLTTTFSPIAPICSGGTIAPLPTTSLNGVTGTWSPSPNNTATTTYNFTPNAGQCATPAQLSIVVNPNIVPTFNTITPVCSGNTLSPLPTTSLNGITGTWSPALNNTLTTTYTFTPNIAQCATTAQLQIVIVQRVNPTFNIVSTYCEGQNIPTLPLTSLNAVSGTWSPALNNSLTTTYTFIPNVSQCANSFSTQINIIPVVTPTIDVVTGCTTNSFSVTSPLGNDYQYSLDGGVFQSSPFFFNVASGNHTLLANQIAANCNSNLLSFNIAAVANDVVVNTPSPIEFCDPNNDGFVDVDLTQYINSITNGANYTVTFHETIVDATIDATAIPIPSNYGTINPWNQTLFVRVESLVTSCFAVVQLQLIVHPTPEATTPSDYELCDYTGQVGFESFDLTTKVSEILGAIDPALHTVSFYTTQALAEAGNTPPISNVTSYTNSTAWTQTLYVRVETIATGCYDVVELTLIVHPLPQATLPNYAPYTLCDYTGSIGFEVFDLSSKVSDILLGQTGMEVTFYPSLTAAQNGTNVITTPGAYQNVPIYVQTLGIRITNLTTGCYIVSTMDIRVIPLPTPLPPTSSLTYCDQDQDGVTCGIDLTALIPEILGSSTINYIITFHETQTTADLGVTDIPTPNDYCNIDPYSQTLYVRAEDALTGCYSVIPITFTIDPSPIAPVNIPNIVVCDQDSNPQDAITSVDLTVNTAMVLGQQPLAPSNYTITFYRTQPEASAGTAPIIQTTSYTANNNEVIWMRVENNATGCFNLGSFSVIINTPLALTTPAPLSLCDDDAQPNNQFHVFDLTVRDNDINQGTGYQVAYYPSFPVTSSSVAIATPTSYQNTSAAVQTLGVMVTTTAGCISYTTLTIRVLPVPTPRDPSLATPERVLPGVCESVVNSGQGVVDLTLYESFIRNGDPNVTLIYYPTLADLQANTNAIATPQAALVGDPTLLNVAPPDRDPVDLVQYVYIAVSSNVYQDYTNRDCFKTVRQGFIINPLPEIAQLPLNNTYRICDPNPTIPPPALQTGVFDLTSQINGNPSLNNFGLIGAYQTDPGSTFTVTFYTDASLSAASLITTPTAFTNTSDPQIIYVSVVNNQTGCASMGQFNITVEDGAIANGPQEYTQCDNFGNLYDGVNEIDLITSFESAILGTQDPTIFTVSYYLSENDANGIPTNGNPPTPALTPAEAMAYQNTADTDVIWVKVENTSSTQPYCYALTPINIRVVRNPNPIIQTQNGITTICVNQNDIVVRDLTLDSGISNPQDYTFEWFEGTGTNTTLVGTGSTYTVSTAVIGGATRTYTVRVTTISPIPCSETSDPFDVIQSGPAWIPTGTAGYTVSNAFSDSQTITVTIDGYGTYEYSIDEGPRQTSNVFENVSLGEHIIYVWDTEGGIAYSCDALTIEGVQIIDYPYYFTPNGDGIHDKWNIVGLANQPSAKIYIFDRYGKLLKQISSTGEGWDGTFNGMLMPSTDYWFKVEYIEDNVIKEFKAHFALKR